MFSIWLEMLNHLTVVEDGFQVVRAHRHLFNHVASQQSLKSLRKKPQWILLKRISLDSEIFIAFLTSTG